MFQYYKQNQRDSVMEPETIQKNGASPKSQTIRSKFLKIQVIAIAILFMSSCAKIYYSQDATTVAKNQQLVAIIPPTVSIAANKKVAAEAIIEQQKTESLNFQKEIYSWMLKRKMQGKITAEIQEIETTNAKLKRAGYPETLLTNSEICKALDVDGILISNIGLSKPMSTGAAIAVGILVGAWGSTNEVRASLGISDCNSKKLIWNYEHKLSGSVGSSPTRIVDALMKKASKKMPYVKK